MKHITICIDEDRVDSFIKTLERTGGYISWDIDIDGTYAYVDIVSVENCDDPSHVEP